MSSKQSSHNRRHAFPLWLKIICCAFAAFHLLVNLQFYGPLNYLWFCDIALLTAVLALCLENRLLLGMTFISVLGPAVIWSFDYLSFLILGHYPIRMADYMSDARVPELVRASSAFHLWLPPLLIWMMSRIGYDRRALLYQTIFAIALLVVCRTLTAPPPAKSIHDVVNINSVYGNSDAAPETKFPGWVCRLSSHQPWPALQVTRARYCPAWVYISYIIVKFWFCMYLPTHLLACLLFGRAEDPLPRWNHARRKWRHRCRGERITFPLAASPPYALPVSSAS